MSFASGSMVTVSVAIMLLVWIGYRYLRGTTLIGPWWWALGSLLALLCRHGPVIPGDPPTTGQAALDYMAAVLTLCPAVCLLGAKRPQHRAWHLIVASLWVVLALPAAESLWLQRSGLQIHDARGWFLWLLVFVGLANHLPTRFALPALLVALAQVSLLMPHLPLLRRTSANPSVSSMLLLLALWGVAWGLRRRRRPPGVEAAWVDFRNAFGAAWALRIMERVNAISQEQDWQVELTWSGLVDRTGADRASGRREPAEQCLQSFLKRFVSDAWLRERTVGHRPAA